MTTVKHRVSLSANCRSITYFKVSRVNKSCEGLVKRLNKDLLPKRDRNFFLCHPLHNSSVYLMGITKYFPQCKSSWSMKLTHLHLVQNSRMHLHLHTFIQLHGLLLSIWETQPSSLFTFISMPSHRYNKDALFLLQDHYFISQMLSFPVSPLIILT